MLLEEIILRALEAAGYATVLTPDNITIHAGNAGLELDGRGTRHQIDAIADYHFQQPFSHPQRLLVEAKCYWDSVGLETIRNAVGVHKDVSEYWNQNHKTEQRFHYQYAVFSANRFSPEAEAYAFAQDVYLFPLGRSHFFRPILKVIWSLKAWHLKGYDEIEGFSLRGLRAAFRAALRNNGDFGTGYGWIQNDERFSLNTVFQRLVAEAAKIEGLLFASTRSGFLIMLVPNPAIRLQELLDKATRESIRIRVHRVMRGWFWYLESQNEEKLFTLDIPPELFRRYSLDESSLDQRSLLQAKEMEFSTFHVPYLIGRKVGIAQIKLDQDWIEEVRRNLGD